MKKNSIKLYILSALMAALTAVCSQIAIPLPFTPVPINLATFAVFLSGSLLGAKFGLFSQVVYVLLGAVGAPVFQGLTGGIGIIMGPTGGYIIGYIFAAFATGLIISKANKLYIYFIAMTIGLILCYTLGTAWFMIITKNGFVESLMMCVVPFLIGDAIKIVLASLLSYKLKPILLKQV